MSYSIAALKTDLAAMSHGTTTNSFVALDNLIDRAARQLLMDCDPQETKRFTEIPQVYVNTFEYGIPADLKGNKVIDIFPYVDRWFLDQYTQLYNQNFDITKNWSLKNDFTIKFNNAIKTLRVNAPFLNNPTLVNAAESVTANGTWTASGGATGLRVDNTNFVLNSSSLAFDLDASGIGTLTNSTLTAVNLSTLTNQGTFFVYVYMPDASSFTSVMLRWGSSATNYHEKTVTVTQANTVFQNGWNLLAFSWLSPTNVGSPNDAAISYLRLTVNYVGAQVSARVNNFNAVLGTVLGLEYYSKYLFRSSAGVWQETVLDDSDLVNLDTESYNLLTYQAMMLLAQQLQGLDALFFDASEFEKLYTQNLQRYQAQYKSEIQKPQSTYYVMPQAGYTRYLPRRFR